MDHFGDLATADEKSDFDQDGYSDLFEYQHDGELDPGGENTFDPTIANAPHEACVDIIGGRNNCYQSLELLMDDFSQNFPGEPVFVRMVLDQICNDISDVVIDDDTFYDLCGGYEPDFSESPEGVTVVEGTLTIRSGKIGLTNIVIMPPQ